MNSFHGGGGHRDDFRGRPSRPRPRPGGSAGFSRPSRPSRGGSQGRPPPRPKAPPKPAGPAVFQPLVPQSRGEWKRMYTGTIKRLSRQLGRHAHDLLDMSESDLIAAADAMPRAPSRKRGIAMQLIRKLSRLRDQKPRAARA